MGTNRRLPQRGSPHWLKSVAANDPTGAPSSAVPSAPSDRPRSVLMCGMWATHDDAITACAMKAAVTATFARRSRVASLGGGIRRVQVELVGGVERGAAADDKGPN